MVCVLEQDWNKTLQGCGPPGKFDTPGVNKLSPKSPSIPSFPFSHISLKHFFSFSSKRKVPLVNSKVQSFATDARFCLKSFNSSHCWTQCNCLTFSSNHRALKNAKVSKVQNEQLLRCVNQVTDELGFSGCVLNSSLSSSSLLHTE